MKRYLYILVAALVAVSCEHSNSYEELCMLKVKASFPAGFEEFVHSGIEVNVEDINQGYTYTLATDNNGEAKFTLAKGLYRIGISDATDEDIFNGTVDKFEVNQPSQSVNVNLMHSKAGSIVIKEIYTGGCKKLPEAGTYQTDKYIILHNNDNKVRYLDGLCFGTISPYNSNGTNPWTEKDPNTGETIFPDFLPVAQCVLQFPGNGTSFPLQPGEDAVLCLCGAVDHTVQYPLSVNLNKPGYFVVYNTTYFTNTSYHPAPGDKIGIDHYMNVLVKTGPANAYTVSVSSPAMAIFQPKDVDIVEYLKTVESQRINPGDSKNPVIVIPIDWVMDAVEVFNGTSTNNTKRLNPALDAGYVTLSNTYLGHTLYRNVDEKASQDNGYEVLMDTNNSGVDFYEREIQSLHE